jgi:DNA repair protein RadC
LIRANINQDCTTLLTGRTGRRPRERLIKYGPGVLSAAELIAIQLRVGTKEHNAIELANVLLKQFDGLRGVSNATVEQLGTVKGVGSAKAAEILAAVELGRRLAALSTEGRPQIHNPDDVANLLMPEMRDAKREFFKAVMLDTKNTVIRITTVSIGTLDSSLVHPREVFKDAITASAASVILAHNHPSGDPTPSKQDLLVTERLVEAGKLMGIDVLDHIILGDNRWISLKQRGLMAA